MYWFHPLNPFVWPHLLATWKKLKVSKTFGRIVVIISPEEYNETGNAQVSRYYLSRPTNIVVQTWSQLRAKIVISVFEFARTNYHFELMTWYLTFAFFLKRSNNCQRHGFSPFVHSTAWCLHLQYIHARNAFASHFLYNFARRLLSKMQWIIGRINHDCADI